MYMDQQYVCSITPTEFEKYCLEILSGYAEEEKLKNFKITHNVKIPVEDGTYQIDVYALFPLLVELGMIKPLITSIKLRLSVNTSMANK